MSNKQLRVTVAKAINFLSTTVPGGDFAPYDPNEIYSLGGRCTVEADGKNYYCTKDGTQGKEPKDNPDVWESEPMNKLAMLDYTSSKRTEKEDEFSVTFNLSNCDQIAFFQVEATSIHVNLVDNTTAEVFDDTLYPMEYDDLDGFGSYLFSEKELRTVLEHRLGLEEFEQVVASLSDTQLRSRLLVPQPILFDATVTVTFSHPQNVAKCGYIVAGRQKPMGIPVKGGQDGLRSYAKKIRDSWGNMTTSKGNTYNIIDLNVNIPNSIKAQVMDRFARLDGVPCVFAIDGEAPLFGVFFDIEMPHSGQSTTYTVRLESLLT